MIGWMVNNGDRKDVDESLCWSSGLQRCMDLYVNTELSEKHMPIAPIFSPEDGNSKFLRNAGIYNM
jgi:hypothetical protein